jgi:predicted DNA-binding transcriptional regulator AlpA
MARRFIYKAEVLRRVGLTFPTVWKLMMRGEFPRSRVVADGQRVAWFEDEVDAWMESRPTRRLKGDQTGVPSAANLNRKTTTRTKRNREQKLRHHRGC